MREIWLLQLDRDVQNLERIQRRAMNRTGRIRKDRAAGREGEEGKEEVRAGKGGRR